jgi:hypothetical protein
MQSIDSSELPFYRNRRSAQTTPGIGFPRPERVTRTARLSVLLIAAVLAQ